MSSAAGAGRRSWSMQRLCATRYSHARSATSRPSVAQRVVRAQEHVLQDVLGVGPRAAEHLARVGEEPRAVAVVDRPEGLVVAGSEERDELLVGAQSQQGPCERYAAETDGMG